MFKGPTYKASLYFQQQLFLKVLRQCGKSFGDQNTIKVFCHPSEKKKKQKQKRSVPNPHCRVNFSEWFNIWEKKLDSFARANNVCTCTDCLKQRSRMLWLSRLDWVRGTQREYSSKPHKHSIVERTLVFKQYIKAYFYPLKIFHLFGFPSWKYSDPKIIGIKIYLFENFSQKKGSRKF